ncbi:MAG: hypothetical protein V4650_08485 [Pseudomonadota bacterium]
MITNTLIDETLLQLMLDRGAWESNGIAADELLRCWPGTTLRSSDFTEALDRIAQQRWVRLTETSSGHFSVAFTDAGFERVTGHSAASTKVYRGLASAMQHLSMQLGFALPSTSREGAERRRNRPDIAPRLH